MGNEKFTDPEDANEGWVDVRMTNPEEEEWDVDFVVMGGEVNYIDLRIRPELLDDFVNCLIEDMSEERASQLLEAIAEGNNVEFEIQSEDD